MINFFKSIGKMVKRNFKMGEWVERCTAIAMGVATFIAFAVMGWPYGLIMLAIAVVDPRWFDEE